MALSNLSDVFAYLGGSIWGRIKLIEKVSPKKTVEGLIFSFAITSFLFLGVLATFIYVNMPAIKEYNIVYSILGCQFGGLKDIGK
ncbi:phosphatidate cytidylyltransferase [bacterium]|nr:phosphatidate cytidylyltransferase [bacterium]